MKRIIPFILPVFIIAMWCTGCSTTRNLEEGEKLYTGIKKIEVVNDSNSNVSNNAIEEVEAALAYPPNNAIFGSSSYRTIFPFGLWTYNAWVNHQKGLGKWIFNHLGAKPVYISTVNPEVRTKIATNLLHNYGFFNGKVTHETLPQRNPKKEKISYRIDVGHLYTLDSVAYLGFPAVSDSLIKSAWDDRLLKSADPFSVVQLESERARLSTLFRNNGMYYYRSDYITYRADTIQKPGEVSLQVLPQPGLPSQANRQWYIGNTVINMRKNNMSQLTDSLKRGAMTIKYSGKKPPLRPRVLFHNFRFRHGNLYSQELQLMSQENMARMGIFSAVELKFVPRDTTAVCDTLDVYVNAVFDKLLDGEFEMNVTSKSNDQVGPGVVLGVSKRNVFRGGETFSVKLNGSYEWQTGKAVSGNSSAINSYEIGLSTALTYPRLMFPGLSTKRYRFPASTEFKLYVNQLNRANFFRMLSFGGNATYSLQPSPVSRHTFTPFRLSFNLLQSHTERFDTIMDNNKALAISFRNQFIPAMSYTYTYDNSSITSKRNHLWWSTTVTSAGNLVSSVYALTGKSFSEKDKSFMGNPFAQFMKLTTEVRNQFKITGKTYVATRLMAGIVYSYGNTTVAPYSEQFYIGGANSIRAFTARTIGPGRYRPAEETTYSYLDETGDIKFEANVELRFPLLGNLYGATFLDAGNVWLLRSSEDKPEGTLSLKGLADEIALGTGFGFRYDLEFLVIRLDLGIALHAPYKTTRSGYYNIPKFKDGLGFHLAIGYPF